MTRSSTSTQKQLTTDSDRRTREIAKKYGHKTDRELLEEQIHISQHSARFLRSIKNSLSALVGIAVISLLITIVAILYLMISLEK